MPLTVATFNLKDLFLPRSDAERLVFSHKLDALAALLAEADADVVGLQEVGGLAPLRALLDRVSSRLLYRDSVVGDVDARGIGNALAARVPVLARALHTASKLELPVFQRGDPSPFGARIALRRAIVHAIVDGGSEDNGGLGPVHVFVCHFKSKLPAPIRAENGSIQAPTTARERSESELRSLFFRAAEALFLRGQVDAVLARAPRAHVVVLGDFNDTLDGAAPRVLLAEGHRAGQKLPGALYSCSDAVPSERRFTVLHGGVPEQIDHVLVTEGLRARLQSARILNDELRDHGPFTANARPERDSDHAPLVVRFD
jgi:endonuclease/exonuclease/phosphatase family metal-dependent hydrolase